MSAKPFNPKRDFGEIYGSTLYAFEQDGQLYNAQKQPVDQNGNVMEVAPVPVPPGPAVEATEDAAPAAENPDDDIPADEKPIDLLAWANGDPAQQALPWITVKAAAARLVGSMQAVNSKDGARKAILAHYGLT